MIIDIIVILKCYAIFVFNYNGGVRIRYPYPNTDTLYSYTYHKINYILFLNQSDKLPLNYL